MSCGHVQDDQTLHFLNLLCVDITGQSYNITICLQLLRQFSPQY